MQRVAIYVRVSTEEQAKEGFSISAQRQRLMSYAHSMEWDIYDMYIDEGYSGAKAERPELNRLRADILNKSFDLVLVWKVDRFFRSVYYLSEILHQMEQKNVGFVSMTESFNTSTPSGKAMLQMLAIFAEFERETIRERIVENLAERARQGFHHGKPPYGYDRDHAKNLVINYDQAEVVKRIFQLRSKGKSYNAIREDIQKRYQDRLHTDDENTLMYFVRRILVNPIYIGQIKHRDEELPGTHDPIIDEETYRIVQSRNGSHHGEHFYIFHGLMYCGSCGSRMTSKVKNDGYRARKVYYCPNTPMKHKPNGKHTCNSRQIDESHVLNQLVDYLQKFELTLDDTETVQDHSEMFEKELQSLNKKISDLRKRKNRYFLMFEEDPDFEEEAKDRIKELTVTIRELELQKLELETSMKEAAGAKEIDLEEMRNIANDLCQIIHLGIEKGDEEKISDNIHLFFDKIIVHKLDIKPAPGRSASIIEPIWIQDN